MNTTPLPSEEAIQRETKEVLLARALVRYRGMEEQAALVLSMLIWFTRAVRVGAPTQQMLRAQALVDGIVASDDVLPLLRQLERDELRERNSAD